MLVEREPENTNRRVRVCSGYLQLGGCRSPPCMGNPARRSEGGNLTQGTAVQPRQHGNRCWLVEGATAFRSPENWVHAATLHNPKGHRRIDWEPLRVDSPVATQLRHPPKNRPALFSKSGPCRYVLRRMIVFREAAVLIDGPDLISRGARSPRWPSKVQRAFESQRSFPSCGARSA
jgi:hypothetical protein